MSTPKRKFLVVGAGFYGSVCAHELADAGHQVLVIDKRDHLGGNCFTRYIAEADCHQHVYGAHIFHTNAPEIWRYVNRFAEFNHYVNRVKVRRGNQLFAFPINLFTLYQLWGVCTPAQAQAKLEAVREPIAEPQNLEQWCLSQVGREIYETFVKGYTTKQWGRPPGELPASIIKRLPIRLTFDDNYFNDRYQGIPIGGYTALFERLLQGIPLALGVDFHEDRPSWLSHYDHIIYTGPIDAFFDHCHGPLEYRSLRFDNQLLPQNDFQGNAVINYTDAAVPYTRILEHKHFDLSLKGPSTLITREYPDTWAPGKTEYYPVNTEANNQRYQQYRQMVEQARLPVTFGGRLGSYRYYDMHQVVAAALKTVQSLLS